LVPKDGPELSHSLRGPNPIESIVIGFRAGLSVYHSWPPSGNWGSANRDWNKTNAHGRIGGRDRKSEGPAWPDTGDRFVEMQRIDSRRPFR
jgi:hypothetical protein